MRCPACGYISFEHLTACKRCGKTLPQTPGRRLPPPRPLTRAAGSPPPAREAAAPPEAILAVPAGLVSGAEDASVGLAEPAGHGMPEGPPPQGGPPLSGAAGSRASLASRPKAGFWIRGVAFLVDAILIAALTWFGGLLVHGSVWLGGAVSTTPEVALEWLESAAGMMLSLLIETAYFTLYVGHSGQTPGKKLLRLKVIRTSGEEVGFGLAFVRWIGQGISFLTLGIGYLMIAFTRNKQGLHDKIAGTFVVRLPR